MPRRRTLFGEIQDTINRVMKDTKKTITAPKTVISSTKSPNLFIGILIAVVVPLIVIYLIHRISSPSCTVGNCSPSPVPGPVPAPVPAPVPVTPSDAPVPETSIGTDTLRSNEDLGINKSIVSKNGKYHLVMQDDGNLVVYDGGRTGGKPTWASNTKGSGATQLIMQDDGNLVLYDGDRADGKHKWASDTNGKGGDRVIIDDTGAIQIIDDDTGAIVWSSKN